MQTTVGRFSYQFEQPEPTKFAWPIVLFGDLFTTPRHLASLLGYLATIGWEAYVPDLRTAIADPQIADREIADPELADQSSAGLDATGALASEYVAALGREVILMGHGLGGLIALQLAARPGIKAAVALGPVIPGFPSPLFAGWRSRLALATGGRLRPPRASVLTEFLLGCEPLQFAALSSALVAESAGIAAQIARRETVPKRRENAAPSMIIVGERDRFSPLEKARELAQLLGTNFEVIAGRGHWLIGGRALERAVGIAHRFLVRALGQDLLLLFPEEWKDDSRSTD